MGVTGADDCGNVMDDCVIDMDDCGIGKPDCVDNGKPDCVGTDMDAPGKSGGSPTAMSFDPQLQITHFSIHHWRQMSTIPF